VLVGGAGADIFKVKAGNGSDAIVNFRPGWDVVKLDGYSFTSFAQLKAAATQVGSDVSIKLSSTELLVLRGVSLSSLSASDFGMSLATKTAINADHVMSNAATAYNYNGWYVFNNVWGATGLTAGKDYTITTSFNSKDMTGGTTFNWNMPVSTSLAPQILAFPEVIFGNSPLNTSTGGTGNGVFPLKIADMVALSAKYDVSYGGNLAGFDVAYDIWFSKSTTATGQSAVSNEVMIWVHKGDFAAYGDLVGTIDQNGNTFKVYHSGTYTALVSDKDLTAGTLDLKAIFAKLTTMGILTSAEYLRSVELGAEVASGGGWLTINDLDLSVSSKSSTGLTVTKTVTGAGTTTTTAAAAQSLVAVVAPTFKALTASAATATVDKNGIATGTTTTTVDAASNATVTRLDLAGKSLGFDKVTTDGSTRTTHHYSGAGTFLGVDKAVYATDGSLSTEHYSASFAFLGVDKVTVDASGAVVTDHFSSSYAHLATEKASTAANGAVTTEYYDANFKLTGVQKVTTATGSVTTEKYDTSFKLTGIEKVVANADGTTSVQHYDAAYKLTGADVIKQAGLSTTTWHYDGAWKLTGTDMATTDAAGVTKTQSYDAAWKLVSTTLTGTDRAETLTGSSGTTHFDGGLGGDKLVGGSGADFFHFDHVIGQGDVATITSFAVANDKIVLDRSVFDKLGAAGTLDASAFQTGTTATSAATRVLYDAAKCDLYYDDDGSGAHAAVLLAHIGSDAALKAGNILVS
jgi:hypothetical protein